MSKREWSASDQIQRHDDVASKKRSGQLIAVLENHRKVFCTIRFSECEPVEEDDDDQKLHARREVSSDGSSLSGSLLVASGDGSDDREDGADLVAAAAFAAVFAAAFAAECEDDGDDNDDMKNHSNVMMSSNLENDGLVGLQNNDLDCDGLATPK